MVLLNIFFQLTFLWESFFIISATVQQDVGLVGSQSWVCWSIPGRDGQVVGQEDDLSSGKEQHWVPGPLTRTTGCWRSLLADVINDCHQSHHQRLIVLSPGQQIMTGQEKKTRWWMTLLATPDCPRCCSGLCCVGSIVVVVVHSMVVVVPVSWWRLNGVLAHWWSMMLQTDLDRINVLRHKWCDGALGEL